MSENQRVFVFKGYKNGTLDCKNYKINHKITKTTKLQNPGEFKGTLERKGLRCCKCFQSFICTQSYFTNPKPVKTITENLELTVLLRECT